MPVDDEAAPAQRPDAPPAPDAELPQAIVHPPHKRHLPLVWIVPIVAALAGVWLVVHNIMSEGPRITVRFNSAEGIEPGKTKIRYKDVDIGLVESVVVAKDRKQVILTAHLVKEAADYLVTDTRFWVVRPRIAGGSITGLSTLLSGAYIGLDVGKSEESQRDFTGLDIPPIVTADLPGREFVLHAAEIGSLDVGAPVSFRRIAVGQVIAYQLDPDGKAVTLKIFVNGPYDRYVTESTRFWNASGVDLSLDANGLRLETQSLATLIEGGLAFQTPPDLPAGTPAPVDAAFTLFPDRERAMRATDTERRPFVVYFKDSLRGLALGAPVEFHGIPIGEVSSISVEYAPGQGVFRFPVQITVYPERMRMRYVTGTKGPPPGEASARQLIDRLVAAGMRAQLKTGNLLTGQLFVALDFFPEAPRTSVDWSRTPTVLPSVGGGLGEIQDSLASILKKIDAIPMKQLAATLAESMETLKRTLDDTDRLVQQLDHDVAPEVRTAMIEARRAMGSAQQLMQTDAPTQTDLREALRQVSRSAQAIGSLADYLERHPESLVRGKAAQAPVPEEHKTP